MAWLVEPLQGSCKASLALLKSLEQKLAEGFFIFGAQSLLCLDPFQLIC